MEEDIIFHNDPVYMKSLIGKKVKVTTVENEGHVGIVYVIDPIFKTLILHTNWKSETDYETMFIFYHAIQTLEVLSDEVQESYLKRKVVEVPNKDVRKSLVKRWLQQKFINVQENGDVLKIEDHLVILPPYTSENCVCNNTIILERIQKILNDIPEVVN